MASTDILKLDLSGDKDDALLVPFSRRDGTSSSSTRDVLQRATFSRLFRKPGPKEEKESLLLSSSSASAMEELGVPVRDVSQRIPADVQLVASTGNAQTGQRKDDDEEEEEEEESSGESSDEDSGDETDDEKSGEERQHSPKPKDFYEARSNLQHSQSRSGRRLWQRERDQSHGLLQDDSLRPMQVMEGYGSAPPPDNEAKESSIGRFFRSLSQRRQNLQKMKIATEDTKDQRTLTETLTHAAGVVIFPEIYLEDEDQENTLGYYRPVVHKSEEDVVRSEQKSSAWALKYWKAKSERLKSRVGELEKELKDAQLVADSWKARTQELEKEVRKLRKETENSSGSESEASNEDEDSDVDEDEEDEDGAKVNNTEDPDPKKVKEEILIDVEGESKKQPNFDPLADSAETAS